MTFESIRPKTHTAVPDNVLRLHLPLHKVEKEPLVVVGTRGFYKSLAGAETGKNMIGVYDDAISLVLPTESRTFLGNTDPSRDVDDRAVLEVGLVWFVPGVHGRSKPPAERRPAFVQDSPVSIRRFKNGVLGDVIADQMIGCNLHDGGNTTTGSAACQTVPPEYWREFVINVFGALELDPTEWDTVTTRIQNGGDVPEHWKKKRFPYILTA